jgi:hypothetical protein
MNRTSSTGEGEGLDAPRGRCNDEGAREFRDVAGGEQCPARAVVASLPLWGMERGGETRATPTAAVEAEVGWGATPTATTVGWEAELVRGSAIRAWAGEKRRRRLGLGCQRQRPEGERKGRGDDGRWLEGETRGAAAAAGGNGRRGGGKGSSCGGQVLAAAAGRVGGKKLDLALYHVRTLTLEG